MQTRTWDTLPVETSLLGLGCMRLPVIEGEVIDETAAKAMVDRAMAAGITYYDTAYPYHEGASEPFIGKALDDYDRSSYYLATKLPCWKVEKREDVRAIFEEQLTRLHKDYVDFYLLHALSKERWQQMVDLGVIEECEALQAEGKIRFFGFSFHDEYEVFEQILTYRKWDFCQIQYNYMDTDEQAGDRGYALAEKLGVPLVVMEPVKGGSLANLPDEVTEPFRAARPQASNASWALRWVASKPQVKVILSGMSNAEQLEDNLRTFTEFEPLTDAEQQTVADVKARIVARLQNGCTGCRYCMPCPFGVDIPRNFLTWNVYHMYGNAGSAAWHWNNLGDAQATACQQCGKCETLCPQHLSIREDLKRVAAEFTQMTK